MCIAKLLFEGTCHGRRFCGPTGIDAGTWYVLGSGMVKGIGPHFAKRLVDAFGEQVFDVIEQNPERVLVFLPALYRSECGVADALLRLRDGPPPWGLIDTERALPWVEAQTGLHLAASQRQAVIQAVTGKCTLLTGGPGVGKTTVVNSILRILRAKSVKASLCAPTGRAAKRLSESTGQEAKTIHRLLFDPSGCLL